MKRRNFYRKLKIERIIIKNNKKIEEVKSRKFNSKEFLEKTNKKYFQIKSRFQEMSNEKEEI